MNKESLAILKQFESFSIPLANPTDSVRLNKSPTYVLQVLERRAVFLARIKGETNFRILCQNETKCIMKSSGIWTWEYKLIQSNPLHIKCDNRIFFALENQIYLDKNENVLKTRHYRHQQNRDPTFQLARKRNDRKERQQLLKNLRLKRPSKRLKTLVWSKTFTLDVGKAKCPCCEENDITQFDFECAHIKAFSKGGRTELKNLSPCCRPCNAGCGQKGLWDFKKSLW
jgi:hypothetical protein